MRADPKLCQVGKAAYLNISPERANKYQDLFHIVQTLDNPDNVR